MSGPVPWWSMRSRPCSGRHPSEAAVTDCRARHCRPTVDICEDQGMALTEIAAHPERDHAFLDALAEYGEKEMERHVAERKDWAYHDILTREAMAERVV